MSQALAASNEEDVVLTNAKDQTVTAASYWTKHAARVGAFVDAYGRLPSAEATDPCERELGEWLRSASAALAKPRTMDQRRGDIRRNVLGVSVDRTLLAVG